MHRIALLDTWTSALRKAYSPVVTRHIKQQPFRGTKKVAVEHCDEFTRRKVTWMSKKAPRKNLKGEMTGAFWKMQAVEEVGCADSIELSVGLGKVDIEQ